MRELYRSYSLNWGSIAPVKPHWQTIAKQCLQAYRTYKNWCKALGRYSKLKNSKGKSISMRAINHWRNEFYRLSILERQLRVN